jgi:hypothetical protein
MKRVPSKKLTLNDKTVRTLTDGHLRTVVGGLVQDPTDPHVPSQSPSCVAGAGGCGGMGGGGGQS